MGATHTHDHAIDRQTSRADFSPSHNTHKSLRVWACRVRAYLFSSSSRVRGPLIQSTFSLFLFLSEASRTARLGNENARSEVFVRWHANSNSSALLKLKLKLKLKQQQQQLQCKSSRALESSRWPIFKSLQLVWCALILRLHFRRMRRRVLIAQPRRHTRTRTHK